MEKSGMAIALGFIIVILIVLLSQLISNHTKYSKAIGGQIVLGILMNTIFFVSLFVVNPAASRILYTVVMTQEIWFWFIFMIYTYGYLRSQRVCLTKKTVYFAIPVIVENILLVINVFTEQFFTYTNIKLGNGVYLATEWSCLSVIHFLFCIFTGVKLVELMVKKAGTVVKGYRSRYVACSIIFAVGLICVLFSRIIIGNANIFSVAAITLGIIGLYFVFFKYPIQRSFRMKTSAINNMPDPVLMFDNNNKLQVYNAAAEDILGVYSYYPLEEYVKESGLFETEFTCTQLIDEKTYLIQSKEIWQAKEKFVGTLIVYTDITGQEILKDQATLYATRDLLTGFWNREYFFEMAEKTIRDNPNEKLLMIATDIYHFKLFNEILGMTIGDELLLGFAEAYRENYKRMCVFSRIAADRFALLIPKSDFVEEDFLGLIHSVLEGKNYSMKVHCYVGVYEILDPNINVESMYDRAYMALESVKGDLQNEIAYYQDEILEQRIHETTTLDELDRAIRNEEFMIYLQPQINIENETVVSAEALIRWNKPDVGIVLPGEFIPVFENYGMITKIDYYVWNLACKQLAKWKQEGFDNRSIAVNISAKDFCISDLYESLTGLVEKYKINPRALKLEITESAFAQDLEKQKELVDRLRNYGFVIEIDDFGSGYSSLNSLKEIPFDILKMDLKFFEKTGEHDRSEKIIKNIITLANDLGMLVIAEGIETAEDVQMLKKMGCQMVQGYYYAKPMSIENFEKYIEKNPYGDMDEIFTQVKKELNKSECI